MDSNRNGVQRLFNSYEEIEEPIPFAHNDPTYGLDSEELVKSVKMGANRLRYLLANGRFQSRGMKLTEEILMKVPNHALSWEYRKECLLLKQFRICFESEMTFCKNILLADPRNNYAWGQRRFCIEHTLEFGYRGELEFLDEVYRRHPECQLLWTYRFWLTSRFNLFSWEINQTSLRISEAANNKNVWWYRGKLILISRYPLEEEEEFILEALRANPTSEAIWNHINEFFDSAKLYSTKLKETCLAIMENNRMHRQAVTALVFNELRGDPQQIDRFLVSQMVDILKEKLDTKKKVFWSYFQDNCCGQNFQGTQAIRL